MSRLVLINTNAFDVTSASFLENQTIVLKDKKIVWMGDSGAFEKEDTDQIHDLSGEFVVPGLIDCHVHLGATATPDRPREQVRTNTDVYHYHGLKNGQSHLISGFTTIREVGNFYDFGLALKIVFQQKIFPGPRLLIAAKPIAQLGNQELRGPDEFIHSSRTKALFASGPQDVIRAVRNRKENGADVIKTTATGGVLHGQESQLERALWRMEELEAMVDEAHRLGMHTAAHAHGANGISNAVLAGFDTIEHGTFVTGDIAEEMIKRGTYLVPTHRAVHGLKEPETYEKQPPEVKKKIDETYDSMMEAHKTAFQKGVKFALGTDSGTPSNPHGSTAKEVTLMVTEVGMSPGQAIQTATIEAAKAIRQEDNIGSLEVGKLGDLVVVPKNPLEDITIFENTSDISYVIRDGFVMVKRGKLV